MNFVLLTFGLLLSSATLAAADLYQWTDESGVVHVVDESSQVPRAYRDKVKVFESQKTRTLPSALPLSPSRTYPADSEGRFAQKIALDLGLIKSREEDAIAPLIGAGIRPASGWRVTDTLSVETIEEVLEAARRAANARRLLLSPDGVEAIVQQAAASVLPPPATEQPREEQPPQQVIIQQTPPQIIEVERERVPVYVPVPVTPYYNRPYPPRYHPYPPRHDPYVENGPIAPAPPTGPHTDRWYVPQNPTPNSPSGPFTTNPGGPTHMPFGASHMPFGTSQMPFGTSSSGR